MRRLATYFIKSERNAINSGDDVVYFHLTLELQPHTHPLYIGKCIREEEERLHRSYNEKCYGNVIAIWSGDFDQLESEYLDAKTKLESGANWLQSYRWDLEKKVRDLGNVIQILENDANVILEKESFKVNGL